MTLAATIVWEIQTGGADANGGGYKSDAGTTDYSQQAAAQLTLADGATSGIGVAILTSATGGFTAAMVGSIVHLYTGTNLTDGWFEITGYTDTNTVTLDRAPDDGVGGVSSADLKVGGALATPGMMSGILSASGVSGMIAYIKAGTYNLSTTSINVSGGPFSLIAYSKQLRFAGYNTTREDCSADASLTRPKISDNSQGSATVVRLEGTWSQRTLVDSLHVDGTDTVTESGIQGLERNYDSAFNCISENISGQDCFAKTHAAGCYAEGGTIGYSACSSYSCLARTCTVGFNTGSQPAINCIADACTQGFQASSAVQFIRCTAYGCSDEGFENSNNRSVCVDCYAGGNTGYGFEGFGMLINCFGYSNTAGNTNNITHDVNFTAITDGEPLTDPSNDDFEPNSTASRGALLRGAALAVWEQTANADIGAVQHADPAGGGGGGLILIR